MRIKDEFAIEIGNRVRQRREALGIDQMTLAMRLGIRQSILSNIERGYNAPCASNIVLLANELECTTDYILGFNPIKKEKHVRLS